MLNFKENHKNDNSKCSQDAVRDFRITGKIKQLLYMDRVLSYQSILASAQATQHTNKKEATGAIFLRSLHGSQCSCCYSHLTNFNDMISYLAVHIDLLRSRSMAEDGSALCMCVVFRIWLVKGQCVGKLTDENTLAKKRDTIQILDYSLRSKIWNRALTLRSGSDITCQTSKTNIH